ncbi:MAG: DUF58 domain-containing protein [Fuerstiella sp.]|nr:DUF58 domain-containing protein [Fuerstiella sp.]MCP4782546.1 DUF58 domain-containing protein [Fuerstiella sp.]MCP4857588.1 DUF58 domain-containing protein [Fuerstiella sp.]
MDPKVVMSIRSLELRAKVVVEGFRTGLNKSPRHGFSVEFSEYRQYAQGDDPRFLDWKLYARTDRSYIRLFEDETNVRCYIVADFSRSMSFGSLDYTKHDYARTIAASLAWLLNRQGDAVGLSLFDERVRMVVPARYRPGQLRRIMVTLEEPTSGSETNPEHALEHAARRLNKRGFVVLISDLLAPVEQFEAGLKLLRGCGHDVVVFQVLDPVELNLNIDGPRLFEDLETKQKIYADPKNASETFVQRITEHNDAVQAVCEKLGAEFIRTVTNEPLELTLSGFLHARRSRR